MLTVIHAWKRDALRAVAGLIAGMLTPVVVLGCGGLEEDNGARGESSREATPPPIGSNTVCLNDRETPPDLMVSLDEGQCPLATRLTLKLVEGDGVVKVVFPRSNYTYVRLDGMSQLRNQTLTPGGMLGWGAVTELSQLVLVSWNSKVTMEGTPCAPSTSAAPPRGGPNRAGTWPRTGARSASTSPSSWGTARANG